MQITGQPTPPEGVNYMTPSKFKEMANDLLGKAYHDLAQHCSGEGFAHLARPGLVKELAKAMEATFDALTPEQRQTFNASAFTKQWRYKPPVPKNAKLDKLLVQLSELSPDELARVEAAARSRRNGNAPSVNASR